MRIQQNALCRAADVKENNPTCFVTRWFDISKQAEIEPKFELNRLNV